MADRNLSQKTKAFFVLAPSVAWMAMLPIPVIIYGSIWFQKQIGPRYRAVREQVGILNSQLSNNLSGITTIKSFTAEAHEVARHPDLIEDPVDAHPPGVVVAVTRATRQQCFGKLAFLKRFQDLQKVGIGSLADPVSNLSGGVAGLPPKVPTLFA